MSDPEYYLQKAREMEQLAHAARSEEACSGFIRLADEYMKLAASFLHTAHRWPRDA